MRGNPVTAYPEPLPAGSIPARAGEPRTAPSPALASRVYPRACGGTGFKRLAESSDWGLSPRVRGNRQRRAPGDVRQGSIPARAGEPWATTPQKSGSRVYPRACGGTAGNGWERYCEEGLSPRVRGNPTRSSAMATSTGSIPARAGEPGLELRCGAGSGVYPRACGGTPTPCAVCVSSVGLSPRVRGNRSAQASDSPLPGSIPARAGEPRAARCFAPRLRVYPRACGGTPTRNTSRQGAKGLSPRVRGEPHCPMP